MAFIFILFLLLVPINGVNGSTTEAGCVMVPWDECSATCGPSGVRNRSCNGTYTETEACNRYCISGILEGSACKCFNNFTGVCCENYVSPTNLTRTSNIGASELTIQHETDQTEVIHLTAATESQLSESTASTHQTASPSFVDKSDSTSMSATVSPMITFQTSTHASNTGETGPIIQHRTDQTEGIHLTSAGESVTRESTTDPYQAYKSNKPFMTAATMTRDNNNAGTMTAASKNTDSSSPYYGTTYMYKSDSTSMTANNIAPVTTSIPFQTSTQTPRTDNIETTTGHISGQTTGVHLSTAEERKADERSSGTHLVVSPSLQTHRHVTTEAATMHNGNYAETTAHVSTKTGGTSSYSSTSAIKTILMGVYETDTTNLTTTDMSTVSPNIRRQTASQASSTDETGPTGHTTDKPQSTHPTTVTAEDSKETESTTESHQLSL
uniref:GPI-anchored protein PB15E9.01c-like n=1 Tax=Saccoglossus kowalevskii TaxID=10224 RepID=A0ABM0LTR9_SACKO|nr:PREDICTED: putative GPI-anchored protein PB15E9.01c-like [Saccoglossus kowalevskii]